MTLQKFSRADRRKVEKWYKSEQYDLIYNLLDARLNDFYTSFLRGLCCYNCGDYIHARFWLTSSFNLYPSFELSKYKLCECLLKLNDIEGARSIYALIENFASEFDRVKLEFEFKSHENDPGKEDLALRLAVLADHSSDQIDATVVALLECNRVDIVESLAKRVRYKKDIAYRLINYYIDNNEMQAADGVVLTVSGPPRGFFQVYSHSRYLYFKKSAECVEYARQLVSQFPKSEEAMALLLDCLILFAEDVEANKRCDAYLAEHPHSDLVLKRKNFLLSK